MTNIFVKNAGKPAIQMTRRSSKNNKKYPSRLKSSASETTLEALVRNTTQIPSTLPPSSVGFQ